MNECGTYNQCIVLSKRVYMRLNDERQMAKNVNSNRHIPQAADDNSQTMRQSHHPNCQIFAILARRRHSPYYISANLSFANFTTHTEKFHILISKKQLREMFKMNLNCGFPLLTCRLCYLTNCKFFKYISQVTNVHMSLLSNWWR